MKEVKKDNLVDKPNEMKVVKKDAPASANTVTKDKKKREKLPEMPVAPKPQKGVEQFPTPGKEKVMSLKEHLLDELTVPNVEHEHINVGSRVKKKGLDKYDAGSVGNVTEFDGDTATVKWDNDQVEHVQMNILTKKDIPQHPEASEKFGKISSPFAKKEGMREKLMKKIKEMLFKKDKKYVTASNPQSQSAIKQAGFTQVPNTQDVQGI